MRSIRIWCRRRRCSFHPPIDPCLGVSEWVSEWVSVAAVAQFPSVFTRLPLVFHLATYFEIHVRTCIHSCTYALTHSLYVAVHLYTYTVCSSMWKDGWTSDLGVDLTWLASCPTNCKLITLTLPSNFDTHWKLHITNLRAIVTDIWH